MTIGSLFLEPDEQRPEARYLKLYPPQYESSNDTEQCSAPKATEQCESTNEIGGCGSNNETEQHGYHIGMGGMHVSIQTCANMNVVGGQAQATTNRDYDHQKSVNSLDLPTIVQHYNYKGAVKKIMEGPNVVVALYTGQSLQCGFGPSEENSCSDQAHGWQLALSFKDIRRWELAARAMDRIDAIQNLADFWCDEEGRIETCQGISLDNSNLLPRFGEARRDLGPFALFEIVGGGSDMIPSSILPLIYGGIHLTAWKYAFPSTIEHALWKTSGIGIITAPPVAFIPILAMQYAFAKPQDSYLMLVHMLVCTVIFVFYVGFRAFIVLEAFLSLRHSPLGVYAAIPWVQNFPHI